MEVSSHSVCPVSGFEGMNIIDLLTRKLRVVELFSAVSNFNANPNRARRLADIAHTAKSAIHCPL